MKQKAAGQLRGISKLLEGKKMNNTTEILRYVDQEACIDYHKVNFIKNSRQWVKIAKTSNFRG